jgi:Domain of unknown function (DUF4920)
MMISSRLFALMLLASLLSSALTAGPKTYGRSLTLSEVTPIADILAHPEEYKGKRVLVEGRIAEVCRMRGCWIQIADSTGAAEIRFKVEDGVIEFPRSVKGKHVRAEGIVSVRDLSPTQQVEQGKHEAQEQGRGFNPATIKGPKTVVQIQGEGALTK